MALAFVLFLIFFKPAIVHALLESIHCRRASRILKEIEFPHAMIHEDEITTMNHRFYYWYPREQIRELSFWLDNKEVISFQELCRKKRTVHHSLRHLQQRGFHILLADMTLPAIKKAGFEVVKVIIPELHPLYLDERAKALYSIHHGTIPDDPTLKPHPLT